MPGNKDGNESTPLGASSSSSTSTLTSESKIASTPLGASTTITSKKELRQPQQHNRQKINKRYNLRPRNQSSTLLGASSRNSTLLANTRGASPVHKSIIHNDLLMSDQMSSFKRTNKKIKPVVIDNESMESISGEIEKITMSITQEVSEDIVERIVELLMDECSDFIDDEHDSDEDEDYKTDDNHNTRKGRVSLILDNFWKKGLNEEQINKYSYIFDNLKKLDITIPKILNSNLTNKEKEKSIKVILGLHKQSDYQEIANLMSLREKEYDINQLEECEKIEEALSNHVSSKTSLKKRILELNMDIKYKSIVWEKFQKLQEMDHSNGEYHKYNEWLNWVIKIPWGIYHKYLHSPSPSPSPSLPPHENTPKDAVKQAMDSMKNVHGLQFAKEEVMLNLVQKLIIHQSQTSKSGGQILALEGPPGVGKTYLLKQLSDALNIPFESIPLGGCKDSSYLDGHGFTYEGSMPGRIIQAIKNMKCCNGIIYFDEIDKISDSQHGQEVSSLMLHILDETQNKEFYDKYLSDIPVDLSKIFFVLSINNREKIDPVLRQRLNIIKIDAPSTQDKIEMSKNCMIPIMLKELNLSSDDVIIPDSSIAYIINNIAEPEEGVRSLKKNLLSLIKRIFFLKHTNITIDDNTVSFALEDIKFPITLDTHKIDILLKDHKQTPSYHKSMYM